MPSNTTGTVDVPLSLFSSLDTELSPSDIPEGISPDNSDVVYTPGAVSTRPGLSKVFSAPISSLGPVTYQKSFVTQSGVRQNLYFTSGDNKLWVENLSTAPGVATLLFQAVPSAITASSVTADYSEWIVLSDGVHGADIALQYDGTNLYRLTQDGPGSPPSVISVALPSSTMATSGVAPTTACTSASPTNLVAVGPVGYQQFYYSQIVIVVASTAAISVGVNVILSGSTNASLDIGYTVQTVDSGTQITCSCFIPQATGAPGTGGTLTIGSNSTLIRSNNSVLCTTATAHSLQAGYQVQISGIGATAVGGTISSIVIKNSDNPGIATVTTSTAHGLQPNNIVTIAGVTGTAIATAGQISSAVRSAQIVTITTSVSHGLGVGSVVLIGGFTASDISFNGQFSVLSAPSATTFTYYQYDTDATATTQATATATYVWPLANVDPALNYFTVQTAPSATTFTISLSYTDGTWTGGTVSFGWDGLFYVTEIVSKTQFYYQQYGPNATSSTTGTVTPYGQMSPGLHQLRVSYQFQDGSISAPSPPVSFVANGGQYPSITNMPIGPSNVVARVLQFTGALGGYFFYIPVVAQVNGLVVSTSTVVMDNTSTSVLLDFSDNTLYQGLSVSKPGNNLSNQNVLGPSAGIFFYASRLLAWGNRNKVTGFLNLGFDGGYQTSNVPTGWTLGTYGGGSLVASRLGEAWSVSLQSTATLYGTLQQSAYAMANGSQILLPNTSYSIRVWAKASGTLASPNFYASLSSVSSSYLSSMTVSVGTEAFVTGTFSLVTPASIPSDLIFEVGASGSSSDGTGVIVIDDIEIYPTNQPYIQNQAWVSYADNLTAFDGLTGLIGPQDDQSPIMNCGTIGKSLYIVTGSGLHETADNGQTEPSGWEVDQLADNCGAFSISAVARNAQGVGSAGKRWMAWAGPDGAQIFFGQQPYKISQEIESVWESVDQQYAYRVWAKNDEIQKRCYFGIPTSGTSMQVLPLDYRNLDGEQIAGSPPIHISFTGKMIASDLNRKWTRWTMNMLCGELMYRDAYSVPVMVFAGSNNAGSAQSYTLDPSKYSDDDFGQIPAYYTTFFFVSHEMEQMLQVGSHRHQYSLAQIFALCTGTLTVTPYAASLANPFPATANIALSQSQAFDVDFGINIVTTRCAFKVQAVPSAGTDSYFSLQKMVVNMTKAPWQETRGSFGGTF